MSAVDTPPLEALKAPPEVGFPATSAMVASNWSWIPMLAG